MGQGTFSDSGIGSGGGHGGRGGMGCFNNSCIEGGMSYGDANLPCELGSGSGNESLTSANAGGGILGQLISLKWTVFGPNVDVVALWETLSFLFKK